MYDKLKKYEGKIIGKFNFSKEKLSFNFTDGDKLDLYAQGDCCSTSWFEQISGDEALVEGSILKNVEFIDLDKVIEVDDNGVLKHYGVKFITSNGYADVDMRNSSNGYYGGVISINEDDQYGNTIHPDWD